MALAWTKPYCGVQHLEGHPALKARDYQVSVEDYGSFSQWCVLALRGGHPFTAFREGQTDTAEQARAEAEKAFLAISGES